MTDIAVEKLRARLAEVLGTDAAAELVAAMLIEGEAREDWSPFGVQLLIEQLHRRPAPFPLRRAPHSIESAARATIDASEVFAPLAFAEAAGLAGDLAEAAGIGMVSIRNPGPLGRLAPYALALADRGLVGVVACASRPFVAPVGGNAPALGTNPLAVAVPSSGGGIVADAASSETTWAAWRRAQETGAPLPAGTVVDADGRPTTDPHAATAILPRGGLIGTLLGIAVEGLTNAPLGIRGSSPEERGGLVLAIAVPDGSTTPGDDLAERLVAAGGRLPGRGAGSIPTHLPRSPAIQALLAIG